MSTSLQDLKRAVVLSPGDSGARYRLAEALFAEGQYPAAISQLEKAIALTPDEPNYRRLLARSYERDGKEPKALSVLEEMVRRSPNDSSARDELVGFLLQQGRVDDAILHTAEGVRLDPRDAKRQLMLGDLLRQRRLTERAREVLERAHQLFPADPAIARELRDLYVELGDEAASLRVAGEKDRTYFQNQARQALASSSLQSLLHGTQLRPAVEKLIEGELAQAQSLLDKASSSERQTPAFHLVRGELALLDNELRLAEQSIRAALSLRPDLGLAWNRLGDLAQMQHDLNGAVTHYKKAILYGQDDANALEDLADVYASLGEKAQAEKLYRRAMQKDPAGRAEAKLKSLLAPVVEDGPCIGKVGVLGWSPTGGAVSPLEAVAIDGSGQLIFSGNVGPTGKEAAAVAFSVLKARSVELGVDGLVRAFDLHLHFTDTAIGKDGPSSGLALLLASVSAFTQKPLRPRLAATGEITLHGQVVPVGGIHEKLVAAHLAGMRTVLMPKQNLKDAKALPQEVSSRLELIFVDTVAEAIGHAFHSPSQRTA